MLHQTIAILLGLVAAHSAPASPNSTQGNPTSAATTQQVPAGADPLVSGTVGLGKQATVLIAMSPDCQACLDSMTFYKRLLSLPGMDGTNRRLVVLAKNGVIPVKRVLDAQGFKPHALTSGPAAVDNVKETPTVIVLDAAGKRKGTWTGRLTPAQEAEVVSWIEKH